ncbi:PorV/PorQ family protein, partial [bacterium]|nr:PorV/PorQ family protein [bacterium]
IHSDLTGGATTASGQETNPGKSVAGDLGLYYQDDIQLRGKDAQWAFGLNISNVGTPVSYSEDAEKTPIPTNLRLGGRLSYSINEHNTLTFHADLNKLLVPTPALYERDSTSDNLILIRGKETPESVLLGMFQSFYDAPGVLRADGTYSVATEEFHEISCTLGAEYWYRKQFAIRTGYFHERPSKGNRKYFTFGMGARYRFLTFDLSYLLPVQGKNSPLYNTFRFSLTAELPNSAGSTPLKTF